MFLPSEAALRLRPTKWYWRWCVLCMFPPEEIEKGSSRPNAGHIIAWKGRQLTPEGQGRQERGWYSQLHLRALPSGCARKPPLNTKWSRNSVYAKRALTRRYAVFTTSKMRYFFDESDQACITEQGFIKSTQFKKQILVFVFKLLLSREGFAEHARSFPVKPFPSLGPAHTVTPGSDRVQR